MARVCCAVPCAHALCWVRQYGGRFEQKVRDEFPVLVYDRNFTIVIYIVYYYSPLLVCFWNSIKGQSLPQNDDTE